MNQKIRTTPSFGSNLRRIRKEHGFTQEQIVAKLQLKNQEISINEFLSKQKTVNPL